MATIYRVFNAKNQLVNSERIHRLFRHFSDNYNGVIGYEYNGVEYLSNSHIDDIISYNNTSKEITIQGDYIQFLIRGMLFMMSHPLVQEAYPRTGQTELSINWLAESNGTVITPKTNYVYKLMSSSSSYPTSSWFYWDGDKYVKKDTFNESTLFWGPKKFDGSNGYTLLGLVVNVDNIENSRINTITHHRIHTADSIAYNSNTASSNTENFGFYKIKDFDVVFNSDTGLYNITKKNTSDYSTDWSTGYRFNARKFANLKVEGSSSGISGYMIPVAAITTSGEYVRLLECHSKSSLEDFLTQTAINKLKSDLDSKYVWQGNCTNNTQSKGKIGDLIVSKNHISGAGSTNNLIVDTEHLNFNGLKNNKSNIYNQNKNAGKYYNKNWDDDSGLPLTLQKDGYVWPVDYLRVTFGGTGADNKADARKNLGISSGKILPGDSNPNYENGDIFLKIIE